MQNAGLWACFGPTQQASLVVTGRFHGICLAILAKRPFVAFASNTHKIEGLLKDANLGPGGGLFPDPPQSADLRNAYIDKAIEQVSEYMQSPVNRAIYEEACEAYLRNARQLAKAMFNEIAHMGPIADTHISDQLGHQSGVFPC